MVAFFRPKCRHCRLNISTRPRGLCSPCYGTTMIRNRYPVSTCKTMNKGQGHAETRNVPAPTDAEPGSPEKVAVLEQRARLGQMLWHAADRQIDATQGRWVAPVVRDWNKRDVNEKDAA